MKNRGDSNFQRCVFTLLGALILTPAMFINIYAQRPTGSITGRVVSEDGQPIPHASVFITAVGGRRAVSGRAMPVTDEDGNFQVDGLDPAPYSIGATSPGYVVAPLSRIGDFFSGLGGQQNYVFAGESVTITMIKGGVITGRVTDAAGAPVIRLPIFATRVKDEEGRPISQQSFRGASSRPTDDRGIYRLYGLAPGSYLVATGNLGQGFATGSSPFAGKMSIYYPSATRETAQEVVVRAGDEVAGVDIRYRNERGFSISGKVTGEPQARQAGMVSSATFVVLRQAGTGVFISTTYIQPYADQSGFAFYGLPNGEYEVTATRDSFNDDAVSMASPSRRVTLNGREAAGVDLALAPLASISGSVILEKPAPPGGDNGAKCESKRESSINEIVLRARLDEPSDASDSPASPFTSQPIGAPDEKGVFKIRGLKAGRYRLQPALPDENWYLKSMTQSAAAAPVDVARAGVTLKSGEAVTGVTAMIANGAAGLKGKISPAAGAKLPSRVRIYLIPAETTAKDDLLRFAETKSDRDGSFSFSNLAPGKYLLATRAIPETEPADKPIRPVAWDNLERAKLRKEAEAANQAIELKSCQRVVDHQVRLVK